MKKPLRSQDLFTLALVMFFLLWPWRRVGTGSPLLRVGIRLLLRHPGFRMEPSGSNGRRVLGTRSFLWFGSLRIGTFGPLLEAFSVCHHFGRRSSGCELRHPLARRIQKAAGSSLLPCNPGVGGDSEDPHRQLGSCHTWISGHHRHRGYSFPEMGRNGDPVQPRSRSPVLPALHVDARGSWVHWKAIRTPARGLGPSGPFARTKSPPPASG